MTKDADQSAAFIAKARELEADGDETKADVLMGRLAKMKPEPRVRKTRANRSQKNASSPGKQH